ncbi:DMT family transporter [Sulfurospirillum multivorans]|uniref:Transporter n=2 Tax=Sulfurospirillum multivorans TaxID=66821 RepID=A0AA86AKZ5_SULMK|nr:multidrug resistance efflux transporter family protein [Sulfurospirillum multivorans]AHJ12526.1 putative transporter [Sulfurospirillum multivorans DSM 12446]QEH06021.1 putative transporter [Sulfurospirillum multivorans]
MVALIALGLLSALFFSSTFVLNRLMSLEGGHWIWSASLRYAFMILFLLIVIRLFQGKKPLHALFKLFAEHWLFWTVAGSIGFGCFYALLCFSADYAPAWVIAATWQLTIIASLFVLMLFGRTFPKRIWIFSTIIVIGVGLINTSHITTFHFVEFAKGAFPVLIAAFCYPFGNQLVWESKHGHKLFPKIDSPLLENAFNKVFLLCLGSLPFWVVLVAFINPPMPSMGQVLNTSLVALLAGVVATTLFLLARHQAHKSSELAAVDATQASEVIFALLGEMLFLGAALPNAQAWAGMSLVFVGLGFFIYFQEKKSLVDD